MNATVKKIFDELEDYFARVSHIYKNAEIAEQIVEEYADGTPMELTSVWEVLTLHKNGLADYETMTELQQNIETIANSRLLREFESYIAQLKKEYAEDNEAVDEVVRCKDCEHCRECMNFRMDRTLGCNINGELYEVLPSHFCGYGKRKDGAET